jgi:hypothetical protein
MKGFGELATRQPDEGPEGSGKSKAGFGRGKQLPGLVARSGY